MEFTMKPIYLMLSLFIIISGCHKAEPKLEVSGELEVYISTGELQCQDTGQPISTTKRSLLDAGIGIKAESCGYLTDMMYASVCGGGTGNIHIFTIDKSNAPLAESLGFTLGNNSTTQSNYDRTECSN